MRLVLKAIPQVPQGGNVMRLVYKDTGIEVKVGDVVDGMIVKHFTPPHKPSSSGKVTVSRGWYDRELQQSRSCDSTYYVSIIGAEWVDREDRLPTIARLARAPRPKVGTGRGVL